MKSHQTVLIHSVAARAPPGVSIIADWIVSVVDNEDHNRREDQGRYEMQWKEAPCPQSIAKGTIALSTIAPMVIILTIDDESAGDSCHV